MACTPVFARAVVVATLALGACGDGPSAPSGATPSPKAEPVAAPVELQPGDEAFRFGPTIAAYRPEGATMLPLAEVGDPTNAGLEVVVSTPAAHGPTIALWRFASTGDKDTLEPAAPPTPLLSVRAGDPDDAEALAALRTRMAAGHAVTTRPQGIEAADAAAALASMHEDAVAVLDPAAPPDARAKALARFTRGLDDDLLFTRRGLGRALAALQPTHNTESPTDPTARRVTLERGSVLLSMLRKGDGWTVATIEPTPE